MAFSGNLSAHEPRPVFGQFFDYLHSKQICGFVCGDDELPEGDSAPLNNLRIFEPVQRTTSRILKFMYPEHQCLPQLIKVALRA